ncbi:MAG: hypothetical protein EBT78_15220 [Betaproteobacteria bacterium]|jgi:hypothetical protein|nr:hypothetical protein [Betaproteobacteria bacterium]
MRAKKVDLNQMEIVATLRKIGATVQSLASVGNGCPDLLVGFNGINYLMEIKDGDKMPSAQKLTPDQVKWHIEWRGEVHIVRSIYDAFEVLGFA